MSLGHLHNTEKLLGKKERAERPKVKGPRDRATDQGRRNGYEQGRGKKQKGEGKASLGACPE